MKEMLIPTEYRRLLDTDWREAAVHGGRFSLKSHTVARILLIRARQKKTRVACFREMQNSIADSSHQLLADLIKEFELTDFAVTDKSIVNKVNGSDFLFKGLHRNEQSIKSTEGIDIAWIEEAQAVSEKSIEVLTPTVRKPGSQIIYTYNRLEEEDPVHKRLVIEGRPNTIVINQNYDTALKYGLMPDEMRLEMEDDKERRPDLYKHKWMGEPLMLLASRIYTDWEELDDVPHQAQLVRYGLDFGYSNDPTAIVAIYLYNGGYILDEIAYKTGMKARHIADALENEELALAIGDSSDPRLIDDIKERGINITGAIKKKDPKGSAKTYVEWRVSVVQDQRISYTKRSQNIGREYRNYLWSLDKDGNIMVNPSVPEHEFSHAMNATEYGICSIVKQPNFKKMEASPLVEGYYPELNI